MLRFLFFFSIVLDSDYTCRSLLFAVGRDKKKLHGCQKSYIDPFLIPLAGMVINLIGLKPII